jgi:uncharacterized protein (DUF697 family)
MEQTLAQKMEAQINEKLGDAFESVVKQKNDFYQKNPQKIPEKNSTTSLISSVALTNSAISGGANLIPGPWGMLAVVPELMIVIRNQIALIYDIAAANGKQDLMTKELAAMVFISGMGTGAGSLIVVHGGKYLVKRASLGIFQKLIVIMGGKITQAALKSAVSKWLPGVGAVAMAAWTNYMTRQIGKKANEIFSSDIVFDDSITDIELIQPINESPIEATANSKSNEYFKIKILINLMKIDGKSEEDELNFITSLIQTSELSIEESTSLSASLTNSDRTIEGIESIAASPDDAIGLLANLTALAKIDGQFHITEKLYIKQIGKLLKFSESDIDEVINS